MQPSKPNTSPKKRAYIRRYRTVGPTSEVDETLFATPTTPGSTVQIVTKDLVRNVRILPANPSRDVTVLTLPEFKRISSASRVITEQEKQTAREATQRIKEEKLKAAELRKQQMYEADLSRKENQGLMQLELEVKDRTRGLVERASALRMEEEEEIKQLNKLILNVKCQAIRDAQIQEKKQIQAELAKEEKRLDAIMEVERNTALKTEEQIEELRKQRKISLSQHMHDHIQQRLEDKHLQREMKLLEGQQMRKKQERMEQEDLKAKEEKREKQQRLVEDATRVRMESMKAREQRREEEKLADKREMEYIQKKSERDNEYDTERRRIKKEKQQGISRLRLQQLKEKEKKAEQDALCAQRLQNIADREWRIKQKELAVKKAEEQNILRASHLEQIHHKEHLLALEAGREKAEFERRVKVQQDLLAKHKEEEEKRHHEALRYSEAIRQQVKQQELLAIAKRNELSTNVERLIEAEQQRYARLTGLKEKKLSELKAIGIPDKYCSEVERKANDWEQCLKQQNLPFGPAILPPISKATKASCAAVASNGIGSDCLPANGTPQNIQLASATRSNTCLPPIRKSAMQRK